MSTKATQARAEAMRGEILDCIREGMHIVSEIAAALQSNRHTVTNCLRKLEQRGEVHRKPIGGNAGGFYWYAQGDRAHEPGVPAHEDGPGDRRRVRINKVFPLNHRRDPLVAALFGMPDPPPAPVRPLLPRCTACRVEQGASHRHGCLVALVAA